MQVVSSSDQLAIKSEQESRLASRGLISAACKCWLLHRRVRKLSSREINETQSVRDIWFGGSQFYSRSPLVMLPGQQLEFFWSGSKCTGVTRRICALAGESHAANYY